GSRTIPIAHGSPGSNTSTPRCSTCNSQPSARAVNFPSRCKNVSLNPAILVLRNTVQCSMTLCKTNSHSCFIPGEHSIRPQSTNAIGSSPMSTLFNGSSCSSVGGSSPINCCSNSVPLLWPSSKKCCSSSIYPTCCSSMLING